MVWAIDRLGRSLVDLLNSINHLPKACGVDLFVDRDNLRTTTRARWAGFCSTLPAPSAQFERDIIVQRVNAGLDRARTNGVKLGRPRLRAW